MDLDKQALDAWITREPNYPIESWADQIWNQFINEEEISSDEYEGFQDCLTDWEGKLFNKEFSPEEAAPIIIRAFRRYKNRVPKFEPGDEVRYVTRSSEYPKLRELEKSGELHEGHVFTQRGKTWIIKEISTLEPTLNLDPEDRGFFVKLEGNDILYLETSFQIVKHKKD